MWPQVNPVIPIYPPPPSPPRFCSFPFSGTNFVTRYTVQTFYQDEKVPGILYNHDNEFLNYEDDW